MDPLTARRTCRTAEIIHGFVYFARAHSGVRGARPLRSRGLFRFAVCADGGDLGRARDRDVLQLRTGARAPQHGRRLGHRDPRGIGRHAARRHRRRAAPDPGPRGRRVIRRGRGRRAHPPHGRTRVHASLGQATVRRTRVASVARRSAPRDVARPDPPRRFPRRHPHRGDDRRGDRRLRSARHPRRDRRHLARFTRKPRWSDDQWDAVESLRAKGHLDSDGSFTDEGAQSRQRVEDRTDAGALVAYATLGDEGCRRLRSLCRPMSETIAASVQFTLPR